MHKMKTISLGAFLVIRDLDPLTAENVLDYGADTSTLPLDTGENEAEYETHDDEATEDKPDDKGGGKCEPRESVAADVEISPSVAEMGAGPETDEPALAPDCEVPNIAQLEVPTTTQQPAAQSSLASPVYKPAELECSVCQYDLETEFVPLCEHPTLKVPLCYSCCHNCPADPSETDEVEACECAWCATLL
jgi:hypothetical protein